MIFKHLDSQLLPVQPALIKTGRKSYLIRGKDQESINTVKRKLQSGDISNLLHGNKQAQSTKDSIPKEVNQKLSIPINKIEKALAKYAVNFICHNLSYAFVKQDIFNPIINFVLTENYDEEFKFVHLFLSHENNPTLSHSLKDFIKDSCHTLIIEECSGILSIHFFLYQCLFATVRPILDQTQPLMPRDTIYIGLFNYKEKTHEILKFPDDIPKFYNLI